MLTCPNTLGIFNPHIMEIADLAHQAGALLYYDGANLNAIMGKMRPGDVGFDVVHLNLHKTFRYPPWRWRTRGRADWCQKTID
ncbi:glycine dehydrogenase (decarboxylating) subunit 2 [Candidatus Methanoperedenaceae archaeon GB50]|nr:glycine dehydrogenase (decarboxylating) subunit 2 [Candidatus Methanoperedenaceae archaeon GB50]